MRFFKPRQKKPIELFLAQNPEEKRFLNYGKSEISVGRYTYGFENVTVHQWGEGAALRVGAFCSIAGNVNIFLGGNHRVDWITTYPFGHIFKSQLTREKTAGHPATKGDVVIGNDVWIGHGVTIMSGVTIGDGAVIAAESMISRSVPNYAIYGGNPAKLLRNRFSDEITILLEELKWWELPKKEILALRTMLQSSPTAQDLRLLIREHRNGNAKDRDL